MNSKKTKILFDGNCIVCDTEIMHYQKIAPDLFEMIDISSSEFDPSQFGLTAEAVQKEMHLFTPEGKLLRAVDAFTYIWDQIPRYRILSKLARLPGFRSCADWGYTLFARNRHRLPKYRKEIK